MASITEHMKNLSILRKTGCVRALQGLDLVLCERG